MDRLPLIPQTIIVLIGATILTGLTYLVGIHFMWIQSENVMWLEVAGVALNYACVYLATRQNIVNWPIGIAASILLGIFFWKLNLLASMTLQLIYFTPVQIIGWYKWAKGVDWRDDLPATWLQPIQILYAAFSLPIIWLAVGSLNTYFGGTTPFLDGSILVLSIVAQWLMNFKKIESWVLWIGVNVISLYVYFTTGAFLVGLQYSIFLLNAFYGLYLWRQSQFKLEPKPAIPHTEYTF